ncbi:MAG TPA: hypothetical protein VG869_10355 [Acidimicrobiia bacterium]|nr:hypothetical protein [Acidimicrobiia bacterium]
MLTKGDVGINVRVPAREFAAAVAFVSERYDIHQPQNWSSEMTTYRRAKRRFLVQHLEA